MGWGCGEGAFQEVKNSGLGNVGGRIFFDIFTTIGGYLEGADLKNELLMGIKAEFGPYFLSPHYSMQLIPLMRKKGIEANEKDVVGLMLKFADTCIGTIDSDGNIEKTLTKVDIDLIKEGYESSESALRIRWPRDWSFSFKISQGYLFAVFLPPHNTAEQMSLNK